MVCVADTYYQPLLRGYDNAPMWQVEPRNLPYRDAMANAHLPGWPAPPSRQLAENVAKYVVVDMFAKACGGTSTKDVDQERGDPAEGHLPLRLILLRALAFRSAASRCSGGAPARRAPLAAGWLDREAYSAG